MKHPKVLAGILYTIENEFEDCKNAIANQQNAHVQYFVLNNLPKKVAHDTLFKTFEAHYEDYDFFVKVDADMVIENGNLFFQVSKLFKQHSKIKMITVPVWDFFSGRLINGMHFFRNNVKWNRTADEQVFTDDAPVLKIEILQAPDLAPAALHCSDPSAFQAFHYGMHKAIKLLTALDKKNERKSQRFFHFRNILNLQGRFKRTEDQRILFSLAGVSSVLSGDLKLPHINYNNPYAKDYFEREIESMRNEEIYKLFIHRLRKLIFTKGLLLTYTKLKVIDIIKLDKMKQSVKRWMKNYFYFNKKEKIYN